MGQACAESVKRVRVDDLKRVLADNSREIRQASASGERRVILPAWGWARGVGSLSRCRPGFWQMWHGDVARGLLFGLAIVVTAPLILPAIGLWIWAVLDAYNLARRD